MLSRIEVPPGTKTRHGIVVLASAIAALMVAPAIAGATPVDVEYADRLADEVERAVFGTALEPGADASSAAGETLWVEAPVVVAYGVPGAETGAKLGRDGAAGGFGGRARGRAGRLAGHRMSREQAALRAPLVVPAAVPEPGSFVVAAAGLLTLLLRRRAG